MHAGTVWLIVGSLQLAWAIALTEFILHWFIDLVKCDGKTNFNQDQALHYIAKAGYVVAMCTGWVH